MLILGGGVRGCLIWNYRNTVGFIASYCCTVDVFDEIIDFCLRQVI